MAKFFIKPTPSQQKSQQTGAAALVSVIIAIVFAAGIVGMIYAIANSANRLAKNQRETLTLQEFTDNLVGLCGPVIDATYGINEYKGYTIDSVLDMAADRILELPSPEKFSAEINVGVGVKPNVDEYATYIENDYVGGKFSADLNVSWDTFSAQVDIDYIFSEAREGVMRRFGVFSQQEQKSIRVAFSCRVFASDNQGRNATTVAYIHRKF